MCAQSRVSEKASLHGQVSIGEGTTVQENVILGSAEDGELSIGRDCTIRSGTVVYSGVRIGDNFRSGHNVLIRENTTIGNNVLIGTASVVDGDCQIGNDVSIQTGAYLTRYTTVEDAAFLGPRCVTTNDKYMRYGATLKGPLIKKGSKVGANATVMPGITIGEGAVVGAGSVVTREVPPGKVVMGVPARVVKDAPREETVP